MAVDAAATTTAVLSLVCDLRCGPLLDHFATLVRNIALHVMRDTVTASMVDSSGRSTPKYAGVSLSTITVDGFETVLPFLHCTPSRAPVIQQCLNQLYKQSVSADSSAADPVVLMAVAVRSLVAAAEKTFPLWSRGSTTSPLPTPHHIVIVSCVGPPVNSTALFNLLSPTAPGVGGVTCCFVQPGLEDCSDVRLHARVRVVRPLPDKKSLCRSLAPLMAYAIGLDHTCTAEIMLPGTSGPEETQNSGHTLPTLVIIHVALTSCALVREASPLWLRNVLLPCHETCHESAPPKLWCRGVVPCAKIDESWLCGVACTVRPAPASVDGPTRRTGRDVATDCDRLSALIRFLLSHDSVLILQAEPVHCNATVALSPCFVALPLMRPRGGGTVLMLRQLMPAELVRVDAYRVDANLLADDETTDEMMQVQALLGRLKAPSVDAATLRGGILDELVLLSHRTNSASTQQQLQQRATNATDVPLLAYSKKGRNTTLHSHLTQR